MLVNGEKYRINDNDFNVNEDSFKRNLNDNDRLSSKAKLCSDNEAECGAERFVKILRAPECKKFFLKVMYHLPYNTRENILALATRPSIREPKKYFTYCAKKELTKIGY
jgi:hypothetical protein